MRESEREKARERWGERERDSILKKWVAFSWEESP